jgi:hypothetical protein
MITTSDIYRLITVHVSDGGEADVLWLPIWNYSRSSQSFTPADTNIEVFVRVRVSF